MVKLIPDLDGIKNITEKLEQLSVSSFKQHLIMQMLEGIMEKKLENVRQDQLYTHITSWKPLSELLEENGKVLPSGTRRTLNGISKFIDVEKHLEQMEEVMDSQSGFIMMRAIKKVRPDLYNVIVRTPGGQKMVWKDAEDLWRRIKKEIRETNKN